MMVFLSLLLRGEEVGGNSLFVVGDVEGVKER